MNTGKTIFSQYMKNLLFRAVIVLPLLISCQKAQPDPPVQPAIDITGRWALDSDRGTEGYMTLKQDKDEFTGEVDAGYVKGTISGNRITIELEGSMTLGTGLIEGDTMSGDYETDEDPYFGTWSAERVPEEE